MCVSNVRALTKGGVCLCVCVCVHVCVCVFIHSSAVTTASSSLSAAGCTSASGNTVNLDMTVERPPSKIRWRIRLQTVGTE